ncbi:MAG: hypothetical protein KC561_10150 [Myxococcales bacterium]|nr:hypothetical protein [Myxococcales bacterium]
MTRWLLVALLCLSLSWIPARLEAQSLGLEVHGGAIGPLSDYVHNAIGVEESVSESSFYPELVDQFPRWGFNVGLTFLLNEIEIRYTFNRMYWSREEVACNGADQPAIRLSTGAVDDAGIRYSNCSVNESRELTSSQRDPLMIHLISLGYRLPLPFYLPERLSTHFVGSLGLAIGTAVTDGPSEDLTQLDSNENSVFAHLGAGVGADIRLIDELSLALEVRYSFLFAGPSASRQEASNRAAARGESSLAATLETFHSVSFGIGLRVNFD